MGAHRGLHFPRHRGKCAPRFEGRVDRGAAELAGRQHGVVSRRQLLALGMGTRGVEVRLDAGRLHRLHHGVYVVGHRAITEQGRMMAAVLAAGPGAVLSHRSAGRVWGMVRWSGAVEVTRPRRFRARDGIRCHRSPVQGDEGTVFDGLPVTTPFRTLIDLAGALDHSALRQAFNEIQVRRLSDPVPLAEMVERHRGRRGLRSLVAVIDDTAPVGVPRNEFEQTFVRLVESSGLPLPRLNAALRLNDRFVELDEIGRAHV